MEADRCEGESCGVVGSFSGHSGGRGDSVASRSVLLAGFTFTPRRVKPVRLRGSVLQPPATALDDQLRGPAGLRGGTNRLITVSTVRG